MIDEAGEQLGVLPTPDAFRVAQEKGLDLVEVAPNANPPVCRIMDYGKFKYEQQKKNQTARKKSTQVQIKEIKFRPKTDEHDYQTKLKHIRRFLEAGDRCKATIFFRGREVVHKDRGLKILERVEQDVADMAKVEQRPMFEGRTMNMMLVPVAKKQEEKPAEQEKPQQDQPEGQAEG